MRVSRRFLYVVVDHCLTFWGRSPSCTLHRIDPSRLFYPDGQDSGSDGRAPPLPEPSISFQHSGDMHFSLLGRHRDKIVGVDDMGCGVLYDDGSSTVRPLPSMAPPKSWRTLSVAVDGVGAEDDGSVYVIEEDLPLQPVQALVYQERNDGWAWRSHPPPPYLHDPGRALGEITCHAVDGQREGDGSLVWVSTAGLGTYWLDTATHVWTKAGDWALPFQGQAVPAPELGLWVGFSAVDSGRICASNLAAALDEDRPPAADQVWEGFAVPEGFHELYSHLVYLGGRRFCVAKVFERKYHLRSFCCCSGPPDEDEDKSFATFTGVEVVHGSAGRYRMIKHSSLRYGLAGSFTGCVL